MKTIRRILLALCLATMALGQTAPMTLGWDGMAPSYEVWRGIERMATVTNTQADLQLPVSNLSTLTVVAIYPTGERLTSETFTVQPIRVEHSRDLQTWESRPVFFLPYSPRLFLRAAFITP